MLAVNAWYSTKDGLVKITAFGYDKVKGGSCEFQKCVAEVIQLRTGQISKYPTLINATTKRMNIKELNLCVTAAGAGTTRSGKRVRGAVVQLNK